MGVGHRPIAAVDEPVGAEGVQRDVEERLDLLWRPRALGFGREPGELDVDRRALGEIALETGVVQPRGIPQVSITRADVRGRASSGDRTCAPYHCGMSLTDDAIEQIKAMIVSGELRPGDRLPPEKDLADRLGLSRNSLREAVKALEVIRVVDVRRGDGTYVTSLDPALLLEAISFGLDLHNDRSVLELFAVRRVLEAHAAGLAAQRADAEQIAALEAEIATVDAATSIDELVEHDVRLHRLVAAGSGNRYLAGLIESLAAHTVRARVWRGLTEDGAVQRTLVEHAALVDAIRLHDVERASVLASSHVSGVEEWLRRAAAGGHDAPSARG